MSSDPAAPRATISTELTTRVVIVLVAVWDLFAGLVLLAFHGASRGALGAGVEDEAGQRLLGAHLLVLVPVYLTLAWRPQRFLPLLWLPFAAQGAVVLVIGYNMLEGDTDVGDGLLAFAVSLIFVLMLGFLWVAEQRTVAQLKSEAESARPPVLNPPQLPPGQTDRQAGHGAEGGLR